MNLADNPKKKNNFKNVLNVAEKAFKKLFEKQKYKPEQLFEIDEYKALVQATAETFDQAIPHEVSNELRSYLERDVFIFSGLKIHTQLAEARSYLKNKDGITPYHEFEQKVLKLNKKYNRHYLEAEYEFAVQSAQSADQWNSLEENDERYWLQYRTAQDDRVRVSHQALHDVTLPKTDPFWNEFYPPNGWRCRCVAVEVLARNNEKSDSKKAIEKGKLATSQINKNGKNKLSMFRFNPGKTKKVFPPKNSYTKVVGATTIIGALGKEAFKQILKKQRKEVKDIAVKRLKNKVVNHKDVSKPITFSATGIKEAINQNHDFVFEKNELIKTIDKVIPNAEYVSTKKDNKGRPFIYHYLKIKIKEKNSFISIREDLTNGSNVFWTITDEIKNSD